MLGITFAIISILGFGLYVKRLANISFEISLVFVCTSLILILYLSSLFDYLKFASQFLLIVGVGSFVYLSWRSWDAFQFNPSAIVFLIISTVVLLVLSTTPLYSNYSSVDDYSHWGIVAKIISNEGRLVIATDAGSFKGYPPGLALLYYFFLQLDSYSDSLVIFANALFVMVVYAPLFNVIPKDCSKYVLFGINTFLYAFLSVIVFTGALRTIGVDLVLGQIFGITLFIYLSNRMDGRIKALLIITPLVLVLPVIKIIGFLFSAVIICVILCDIFVGIIVKKDKVKLFILSVLLVAATFLIYKGWGLHVENMGSMPSWNTSISVEQVVQAFTPSRASEREIITINNFANRFFHITAFSNFVIIGCLLFLSIIWHTGRKYAPLERVAPFVVILLGFYGYLFVLLLVYLFAFDPYSGQSLASDRRYTNTYFFGMIIAFMGVALSQFCTHKQSRRLNISLFLICLITVAPHYNRTLLEFNRIKNGEVPLEKYFKHANKIKKLTPQDSKIYLIWQGESQDVGTIFRYFVSPRVTNYGCESIGDLYPHKNGDPWTCQLTLSEFKQTIINYDYLYIAHTDMNFNNKYLNQFGVIGAEDGNLFMIVKDSTHEKQSSLKDGSALLRLFPVTSPSLIRK